MTDVQGDTTVRVMCPEVFMQLRAEDNPGVDVESVTVGSNRPVTWRCDAGHTWVRSPKGRLSKGKVSQCPYCANKKVWPGFNDCFTRLSEEVMNQWDDSQDPAQVVYTSSKKIQWTCDLGHTFSMSPQNRSRGQGCPYCAHRKVLSGFNDLVTAMPSILDYWDDSNTSSPHTVLARGTTPIVLHCDAGHTWTTSPYRLSRRDYRVVCSACHKAHGRAVASTRDLDTKRRHDSVIQDRYVRYRGVEHDFVRANNGCTFLEALDNVQENYTFVCAKNHRYEGTIPQVALRKQPCVYCSGYAVIPGETDFFTLYPQYIPLWDSDINGPRPLDMHPSSQQVVSWVCSAGHHFLLSFGDMHTVVRCPYCTGHRLLSGFNDLQTKYPQVAAQWCNTKNNVTPDQVMPSSNTKYWWTCDAGHTYEATPGHRIRGQGCPYCAGKKILAGFNDVSTLAPDIADQWDYVNNAPLTPADVTAGSGKKVWWICDRGHSWQAVIADRHRFGCPQCAHITSDGEKHVVSYLRSVLPSTTTIVENDRSVLQGKELDILIPDHHMAVEYNGLYWHDEHHVDNNYHYSKWKQCQEQGIQLLTIWEDDWRDRGDVVRSMLAHKLHVDSSRRVYARKTTLREVSYRHVAPILDTHHIQGAIHGSYYPSLIDTTTGETVAVAVVRREKNTLYLQRYATTCTVIGGAGKILAAILRYGHRHGCTRLVTFSDNGVSDGGLYQSLGFTYDKDMPPDYSYSVGGVRHHKFSYRKDRFRTDPRLDYLEGLTERELAALNGLTKLYDCGKIRWTMDIM